MDMMSIVYEDRGEYKKALGLQKQMKIINDSLLNTESIQKVTALTKDAEFKIEEEKTELYFIKLKLIKKVLSKKGWESV